MSTYVDNRTHEDVHRANEARIEALKREIHKLQAQVAECHRQALAKDQAIAELIKGSK